MQIKSARQRLVGPVIPQQCFPFFILSSLQNSHCSRPPIPFILSLLCHDLTFFTPTFTCGLSHVIKERKGWWKKTKKEQGGNYTEEEQCQTCALGANLQRQARSPPVPLNHHCDLIFSTLSSIHHHSGPCVAALLLSSPLCKAKACQRARASAEYKGGVGQLPCSESGSLHLHCRGQGFHSHMGHMNK